MALATDTRFRQLSPDEQAYVTEFVERAALRYEEKAKEHRFRKYRQDPVAFGVDILGDEYTEDIIKVMESVRDNPVTIARSATAVGKTFAAARIAIWWYLVYAESQVWATAAPPLENLKTLLWGEISTILNKRPELFEDSDITSLGIRKPAKDPRTKSKYGVYGVAIPTSGSSEERVGKFCADADDLFELTTGEVVTYRDLIDCTVDIVGVSDKFEKEHDNAEFFDNGIQPVYEITLDNGIVIRRTAEHPLLTGEVRQSRKTHGGRHVKGRYLVCNEGWTNVEDIVVGDTVLCPDSTNFNFGEQSLDEDYVKFLAYMIGDGCFIGKTKNSNRLQFTQERNDQLYEYLRILDNIGVEYTVSDKEKYNWVGVSINDQCLADFVKRNGLYNKHSDRKFIPECIFVLKAEQIALFLNRLYSTDGWASLGNTNGYKKAEIGYVSKSEVLVRDIQSLLFRFGISSTIRKQKKSWTVRGKKKSDYYWICTISRAENVIKFSEEIGIYGKEESVEKCAEHSRNIKQPKATWRESWHDGFVWTRVKSIEYIGDRETVGVYAPKNHTYLTNLVEHNSGKHAPYLLFILDEGDAIPDEVYEGVDGCASGGHTRILIMFNPKAKRGPVYNKEKAGMANVVELSAFNHPNVFTGRDVIPGAVTREKTVKRINDWSREFVEGENENQVETFEVPNFLVGEQAVSDSGRMYPALPFGKRVITDPQFSYKVLGKYPAQSESQLISEEYLLAARDRYDAYIKKYGERVTNGARPRLGVDIAEFGVDYNVLCPRYANLVMPPHRWSGLDPVQTADKILDFYYKLNAEMALIDGIGIGSSVAPNMVREDHRNRPNHKDPVRAIGVKFSESPSPVIKAEEGDFYQKRDQLWWAMREWLRLPENEAMLPPNNDLFEELMTATYSTDKHGGKITVMSKEEMRDILKRSPNYADALALTFDPYRRASFVKVNY